MAWSINRNGSHNRLMLWFSNWNCFSNLFLVLPTNGNDSGTSFLSWPSNVIDYQRFVYCLWMKTVHTIDSCCDFPIEIVIVSIICFWSCLLIGMVWWIGFCPDLSNASLCFHLDICPDLLKKTWPQFRPIVSTRNQLWPNSDWWTAPGIKCSRYPD